MKARAKPAAARRPPRLHAVILAGGAGERFWPASRRRYPKPLLRALGSQSLLEATLARARRFAGAERVWLVCGADHARAMRRVSGLPAARVLVEPRGRNTAMAVAWAAHRIRTQDPDAVMAVLPADHHIPDARALAAAVRSAGRAAAREGVLVTLGIEPTGPETGYGYIQSGRAAGADFPGLYRVRRFVEKPDAARARRYLRSGGYRWNAGIFVWAAAALLEEIETCAPDLHLALAPLRRGGRRGPGREAVRAAYAHAPSLPVDIAVMERSRRVWVLPVDFAWSDVGTWASLARTLGVGRPVSAARGGGRANVAVAGEAFFEASQGNLVWGGDRTVALLGVEDLAVVDTGDVILVTKLACSSDVRRLVEALRERGRTDLT